MLGPERLRSTRGVALCVAGVLVAASTQVPWAWTVGLTAGEAFRNVATPEGGLAWALVALAAALVIAGLAGLRSGVLVAAAGLVLTIVVAVATVDRSATLGGGVVVAHRVRARRGGEQEREAAGAAVADGRADRSRRDARRRAVRPLGRAALRDPGLSARSTWPRVRPGTAGTSSASWPAP